MQNVPETRTPHRPQQCCQSYSDNAMRYYCVDIYEFAYLAPYAFFVPLIMPYACHLWLHGTARFKPITVQLPSAGDLTPVGQELGLEELPNFVPESDITPLIFQSIGHRPQRRSFQ